MADNDGSCDVGHYHGAAMHVWPGGVGVHAVTGGNMTKYVRQAGNRMGSNARTGSTGDRHGYRLMAVHAHPDDESSKGAAATAMYAHEGANVLVVSCTGGERGSVLNPRLQGDPEVERDLVGLRRTEMAKAQEALGVDHAWLGFIDSGLPEGDPLPPLPEGCFATMPMQVCVEALVRLIRQHRPHVVTTYDENGGYPHPDHVRTHDVSVAAFRAAGDPEQFPQAGPPWQPLKLYYNQTLSMDRLQALHTAMKEHTGQSPFEEWIEKRAARGDDAFRAVTTRVPVADWFDARDEALRAHATQVDPDGFWFGIPQEIEREVWPWEDFEMAISYVHTTVLPEVEDDVFAGLPEPAQADAMGSDSSRRPSAPLIDDVKER
ncbi:1D-myo-inositol 2-acetamido-2-deoxy-alpha-D-glucopyranoside deacetylase [Dermatophilus congolensis]|uniref:Mycothiol S-conjugate amidase n=2 Tax=Dermatophilus congolensis TaxID=1863 RepID=A0AA46BP13_9MICO|nr:1D-myo-inositol 2-acetamido-2-deoxy-alpha-D-glucopyranoside deacetylase [Dermatophilus congolensis]